MPSHRSGLEAAAAALAQALDVPFDVLLVRRLHVPGHEELALGAVASTGVVALDRRAARELNLSLDALEALVGQTVRDLDRQARSYRGERPPPDIAGQVAILVDDAAITADRMRAAELRALADEAVCLREPERVDSPAKWYMAKTLDAQAHYATGMQIAESSLPEGFGGVLGWGWIDNRLFLRCLLGLTLTGCRLGQHDQAEILCRATLC